MSALCIEALDQKHLSVMYRLQHSKLVTMANKAEQSARGGRDVCPTRKLLEPQMRGIPLADTARIRLLKFEDSVGDKGLADPTFS